MGQVRVESMNPVPECILVSTRRARYNVKEQAFTLGEITVKRRILAELRVRFLGPSGWPAGPTSLGNRTGDGPQVQHDPSRTPLTCEQDDTAGDICANFQSGSTPASKPSSNWTRRSTASTPFTDAAEPARMTRLSSRMPCKIISSCAVHVGSCQWVL